jgi:hypothetical protein
MRLEHAVEVAELQKVRANGDDAIEDENSSSQVLCAQYFVCHHAHELN